MNIKAILEWAIIASILLLFFYWVAYSRPAQAQDYGYDEGYQAGGEPEYWSDVQQQPQMIIYRDRGYGRDRQPEYWSDIQQQPDMIIYPGRGRFSRH